MLVFNNRNDKIKSASKEMAISVAKELYFRIDKDKEYYKLNPEIIEVIKTLVDNEADTYIRYKTNRDNNLEGKLLAKQNSVFAAIDSSVIDVNNSEPTISGINPTLISNLANKVHDIVKYNLTVVTPYMQKFKVELDSKLSELNENDIPAVEIVNLKNRELYNTLEKYGYYSNTSKITDIDPEFTYNKPLDLKVLTEYINGEATPLKLELEKFQEDPNYNSILEEFKELLEESNVYGLLMSRLGSYNVIKLDVLTLFLLTLKNYIDSYKGDDLLETVMLSNLLKMVQNRFKIAISNLRLSISKDIVIAYIDSKRVGPKIAYVIEENLAKAIAKDNDISMATIEGVVINNSNTSHIDINTLISNKDTYNEKYKSYQKFKKLNDINSNKNNIINTYIVTIKKVIDNKFLDYNSITVDTNQLVVKIGDYLNLKPIGDLIDTEKITLELFSKYLATKSNYDIFTEIYSSNEKILGKDFNVKELTLLTAINMLIKYLILDQTEVV